MKRFRISIALVILACLLPGAASAAPPDLAAICATLFMPKARALATVNGAVYPLQWYRMSMTRTLVTLDLVITFSTSAIRYSGFECQQGSDGTVTMIASPK